MEGDPTGNEHHGDTLNMIVPVNYYYRWTYTFQDGSLETALHSQFVL